MAKKKVTKKAPAKKKAVKKTGVKKAVKGTKATEQKWKASAELKAVTGKSLATRGEHLKAVWAYATKNELKTTKKIKGRCWGAIESDSPLMKVFKQRVVSAPEIMKGLSAHLEKA